MTCKREIYNIYVSHGLAAFMTLLSFASILLSETILPTIDHDSEGYLKMAAYRPVLYPLFLRIGSVLGDAIFYSIILQTILYLSSFYALIFTLHRTFDSLIVTFFAGMAIGFNIYLQTFHTTILTESLAFTFMNGLTILLIRLAFSDNGPRRHHIIFLGLITGLLIALKPALATLLPAISIIVTVIAYKKKAKYLHQTAVVLGIILLTLVCNRVVNQIIHQEKDSLSHYILFGKAAILTTDPDFRMPTTLSPRDIAFYQNMQAHFEPYKIWLSSEKNPLITSNIRANIEVYAQMQLYPRLTNSEQFTNDDKALMRNLGKAAILENPTAYIKLSLFYLFELWSVQALPFSLMTTDTKLPDFDDMGLNSVLPNFAHANSFLDPTSKTFTNLLALIVFPAFVVLGLTSFCLLFVFIYISGKKLFWSKKELTPTEIVVTSLLLIGWSNLVFISFVNIPTPRYLMPHFTGFVLAVLLTLQLLITAFETRKSDIAKSLHKSK